MLKAFKYRLYPTKAQAKKINQNIGCTRLVYNLMLNAKIKHYEATKQTLHITPTSFKSDKTFMKNGIGGKFGNLLFDIPSWLLLGTMWDDYAKLEMIDIKNMCIDLKNG